jgi:hypothetical protein
MTTIKIVPMPGPQGESGGGGGNIADFIFNYDVEEAESSMTIANHDMVIRTTRDDDQDADIDINSADDVWIYANGDDIHLYAADDVEITTNYNGEGDSHNWEFTNSGRLRFPGFGLIENPNNSSGDGYGYSTFKIIPDDNLTTDQYLIIDPTAPNHIHIRAGGVQDYSNAELILGGERAGVRVSDSSGDVSVQSKREDDSWTYQNINVENGAIYIVSSEVAEPDFGDFMVVDGTKYIITSVTRDEINGTTSYETTPSFYFVYNDFYTFTRDNGNYEWRFAGISNAPVLVLPSEEPVIANMSVPGDITLSAYNGVKLSFANTVGAGLKFPDDTIQTTAYTGETGYIKITSLSGSGSGAVNVPNIFNNNTYSSYYIKVLLRQNGESQGQATLSVLNSSSTDAAFNSGVYRTSFLENSYTSSTGAANSLLYAIGFGGSAGQVSETDIFISNPWSTTMNTTIQTRGNAQVTSSSRAIILGSWTCDTAVQNGGIQINPIGNSIYTIDVYGLKS